MNQNWRGNHVQEQQSKPVVIRGTVYRSMGEAARKLGVRLSTISRAAKEGRLDNVGKYKNQPQMRPVREP